MLYNVKLGTREIRLEMRREQDIWIFRLDGREVRADCKRIGDGAISLLIDGGSFEARRVVTEDGIQIFLNGMPYDLAVYDPRSLSGNRRLRAGEAGSQALTASMPGKIVRVLAKEGEEIQAGQGVVIIEAMKMQNEIRATKPGKVQKMLCREGASVKAGEVLAIIE
jgi:biotin carboxyl carrier protein